MTPPAALRAVALAAAMLAGVAPRAEAVPAPVADPVPAKACVILLHGLGRTYLSMEPLTWAVRDAGYEAANIDYPSRQHPIEVLSVDALSRGIARCREKRAAPIHIVTHSMGGILVRHYLAHHRIPELGRVVMLGPPNQGSAVADRLMDQPVYRSVNGPAGQQLGTGPDGIAAGLGAVRFPLGVLAGNERTGVDELLSDGIPGEGDGKVLVDEARVDGMADFRVLGANHTFIATDAEAIREVLHFLREGRFSPPPDAAGPPPQ